MKRTNDFLVGIVVVVCTLAVIVATMWVNQSDVGQPRAHIVARFRDVGNVRVGSAVVIRGVQSGRVDAIELAEGGWVKMRIRLDEEVELPRRPVVLLNAASLFGEWQAIVMSVEALPPNPDVRRQIDEASGDPSVIPGAMLPDIAQLTAVAGGIAGALLGASRGALVEHSLTAWHVLVGGGVGAAIGLVLSGPEVSDALREMPRTMKQLAVVQFFTWLGLFCMWMFFGLATAQQIFGTNDPKSELFDQGTAFAGQTFAWYSIVCFLVAFILPPLAKATSRKTVHSLALIAGGLCLVATGFLKGPEAKTLWQCTMIGIGLAWASILSMPYAMLSGALPAKRMGVYMGIFNFFIVIPEILASLCLEPVVKQAFGDDPVKVVMMGGASLLVAAVMTQFVRDESPV